MKNNLKKQMVKVTIIPLAIMAVFIVLVSIGAMLNSVTAEVEDGMRKDAALVLTLYDEMYPGQWNIALDEVSGVYTVYKGGVDITNSYEIIDEIAEAQDIDITIFCRNIRVLTTMQNEKGERYITSKASAIVENEVLKAEKSEFYSQVKVDNVPSFAYYEPIYMADNTVYGMIGVCRSADRVRKDAYSDILPVLFMCLVATALVGYIIYNYTKRLTARISEIDRFMNSVASGKFTADMSQIVAAQDDELARLANNGRKMASEIRKLVEFDALTEIHNRRYGDKRLVETQQKAARNNNPFCVCMCDIDFFKKVNDTYGHEAGDDVLKAVTRIINDAVKTRGFVARWGGEEFLVVFENTDLETATKLLNKLLEKLRAEEIKSNTDKGIQTIKITMSFGVTPGGYEESNDSMLKRADGLLYQAKETGRNQVIAGDFEEL